MKRIIFLVIITILLVGCSIDENYSNIKWHTELQILNNTDATFYNIELPDISSVDKDILSQYSRKVVNYDYEFNLYTLDANNNKYLQWINDKYMIIIKPNMINIITITTLTTSIQSITEISSHQQHLDKILSSNPSNITTLRFTMSYKTNY